MMDEVMVSSFCEELRKIAQEAPVSDQDQKSINREVLKQKLKNVGAIAGGAALGEGAALLTNMGLRAGAERMGKDLPKWVPLATQGLAVPAMGLGAHMAYTKMRQKDQELLEEARKRGEQR